uniref:Uncharacterized protein n=1 Tax=Meloidogyne enterolobii TaxID=390850 RepID=A0A6V7W070_MELEN|nr:unnamed protein product [Meloidogyne enterolobii]
MKLFLLLICLFTLINVGLGLINCSWNGICTGNGEPGLGVSCGNCYSCTYLGCCHWIYTIRTICCPIGGWRHGDYAIDLCKS